MLCCILGMLETKIDWLKERYRPQMWSSQVISHQMVHVERKITSTKILSRLQTPQQNNWEKTLFIADINAKNDDIYVRC